MTDPQTHRPPSGPPVSTPGRGAAAPELAGRVLPGSAPTPWCPRPAPAFRPGPWGLSRWYPDRSRILLRDEPLLFCCLEPSEGPLEALRSQQGLARCAGDLDDTPLPCLHQSSAPTPRPSPHLQQVLARGLFPTTRSPFPGSLCAGVSGVSAPHSPAHRGRGADRWKPWHHSQALPSSDPPAGARFQRAFLVLLLLRRSLGGDGGVVCRACVPR